MFLRKTYHVVPPAHMLLGRPTWSHLINLRPLQLSLQTTIHPLMDLSSLSKQKMPQKFNFFPRYSFTSHLTHSAPLFQQQISINPPNCGQNPSVKQFNASSAPPLILRSHPGVPNPHVFPTSSLLLPLPNKAWNQQIFFWAAFDNEEMRNILDMMNVYTSEKSLIGN